MNANEVCFPKALIEGYARYRTDHYSRHLHTYEALAVGQEPQAMVISCCDSRVDPAAIFDAGPGELFVVRNVANLVPPHEAGGGHHGTSAAIEFAVLTLGVSDIIVMGHGQCGGIRAYVEGQFSEPATPTFLSRWLSIVRGARSHLHSDAPTTGPGLFKAYEYASVLNSMDNLLSFPFVRQKITEGHLTLHGAHFSIADGLLYVLDTDSGQANPIAIPR